ncbi:MAG: acyl-homoserine-lactone synthase [Caulobacter sp.]
MIHVVTAANRHLYTTQLWEMHQERRRQCVEGNGWVDLVVVDGAEIDDFDDEQAIYLLGFDERMALEVALRLHPTEPRCMLADKFAHLIAPDESPKKGPDVWEATRLFTTQAYRSRKGAGRGMRVFEAWAAAIEVALRAGVSRFVGMIDISLYPGIQASPVTTRLVGLPQPYAYGVVAGSEIALCAELLVQIRNAIGLEGPVSYLVEDEDLRLFGNLQAVQRQVSDAMRARAMIDDPDEALCAIEAFYKLHDGTHAAHNVWRSRETNEMRLDA